MRRKSRKSRRKTAATPSPTGLRGLKSRFTAAVVGPGAIGGVLAARLKRAGAAVVLAGRSKTMTAIRRKGLALTGPHGRTSRIRGWEKKAPRGGVDAVFICVKSSGLRWALRAARRLAGPDTAVVSLLNGVTHIPALRKAFGRRAVIGVCYFAAMRTGPAAVRHMGGGRIDLARTDRNADAANRAARLLRAADFRVNTVRSEERLLWTKAVGNAGINTLGALARKTNGELGAEPAMAELLAGVIREAAGIARASGRPPLTRNMAGPILKGLRAAFDQRNSMLQDIAAGRPTEADEILKPLLLAARRTGRPAPLIGPLYAMIRRLETEVGAAR